MRSPRSLALPLLGLALCLAAGFVPQSPGSTLTVTRQSTQLRSARRVFSPPVCELVEGDRLALVATQGAWHQVRFKTFTGFVHQGDVSERRDVRLSGQGVRENYTAAEAAAARKGFNPEVEKRYRQEHPDLGAAFQVVDRIQARAVPEGELERFLKEGRLLREAQ